MCRRSNVTRYADNQTLIGAVKSTKFEVFMLQNMSKFWLKQDIYRNIIIPEAAARSNLTLLSIASHVVMLGWMELRKRIEKNACEYKIKQVEKYGF